MGHIPVYGAATFRAKVSHVCKKNHICGLYLFYWQEEKTGNCIFLLNSEVGSDSKYDLVMLMGVQVFYFLGVSWLTHPAVYFLLYLLPICTLTGFLESIRSFSEHVRYGNSEDFSTDDLLYFVKSNPFERLLMNQYGFHYHHLRHMYPTVPVFNLKGLHHWLEKNDSSYNQKFIRRDGYTKVLIRYFFNKPLEPDI